MSTEDAKEKEGKDAANLSSANEEYSSSFSRDEAMQLPFKEIVKRASNISSGREGGIANLDEYPEDNDQPTNADKGMDDKLEDRKDISEIKSMKSNKVKRIVSSTSKLDQQESDDPVEVGKFALKGQGVRMYQG